MLNRRFFKIALLIIGLYIVLITPLQAQMNHYCITPPFVVGGVKPNLLLMLDNSASMYDLQYIDKGSSTREPLYCYDQTYNFSFHYAGYFKDWYVYYEYDFNNDYFYETNLTSADFNALSCDKKIPGTLCINGTNLSNTSTPKTITKFVAEGNYLNWLTSSKFDIEKSILTGGKYDPSLNLLNFETRGCVGRRFIKEPITQVSYTEGGTNTPLGLTFAIRGPDHPYSETMLSLGGQTYLEIYAGDYSQSNCQQAVEDIVNQENYNTIRNDLELCLNYDAKGKYCSLDMFTSCTTDSDCITNPGTCNILNDGVCTAINNGVCSLDIAGTCTANNGTCSNNKQCLGGSNNGSACNNNGQCPGGICSKICIGGGKAGAQCNNDNDCRYNACSTGKVGATCSVNADCNVNKCTSGLVGNQCVVNADCNTKACSAPASKVGVTCNVNTDCNSGAGTCISGGKSGEVCLTDTDCASAYKGVCQKPVTQQIKSTFAQSVHECYQFWNSGSLTGNNWYPLVTNPSGCNQVYKELFICRGGERDSNTCETNADCPGGECINGPYAIGPGSPVLICAPNYAGYCASSVCAGGANNGMSCTVPSDCPGGACWQTTTWSAREYDSIEKCVESKFEEFCGQTQVPPVLDPSDDPSSTENYDNLPAIIGDMGIRAQLGNPVKVLTVNLKIDLTKNPEPKGLLQEFENLIHFGAMSFNTYGSYSESPVNLPRTKICQATPEITCTRNQDCSTSDICIDASDSDGSKILPNGYIQGKCSTTVTTACATDNDCPSSEICIYSVGNHDSGLVKSIDNLRASTWTPFAEAFYNTIGYFAQRTDKRLNTSDFITFSENPDYKAPVQFPCQKNNVLLLTDGMSTADLNPDVTSLVTSYNDGDGQITTSASTCPKYAGSKNLDDIAWLAKNRNINDFSKDPSPITGNSETITTFVIFNGVGSNDPEECNPEKLLKETARNGCGIDSTCVTGCGANTVCIKNCPPSADCYQQPETPQDLLEALRRTFQLVSGKAASGTAASVLASGEGSGANLVQAIFYPERSFGTTKINWTGSMKNLWYHIDPYFKTSSIREDTNADKMLYVTNDNIINFYFDKDDNTTKAHLYVDEDGDGIPDYEATGSPTYFESVKSLWEAGKILWSTSPANRTIYTTANGTTIIPFKNPLSDDSPLIFLLQAHNKSFAERLISYTRGTDYNSKFCSSTVENSCAQDSDCPAGETCINFRNRTVSIDGVTNTWKLGDIVNSTPKILSWVPLNTYHKSYLDDSYKKFIESAGYKSRGTVFVGANDGMLHAFKLGELKLYEEKDRKAALTGTDLGKEQWAFIPRNVLPYLRYIADPGYCHLYTVDATPVLFDASIGTTGCSEGYYWNCSKYGSDNKPLGEERWRTILIGGMRLGGACNNISTLCTIDMNGDGVINDSDCVHTPIENAGYSSYFALDVTDPDNPQLLWEFSNENLGFSTTGPAIVRIAAKKEDGITPDNTKNGRWFVVFGSGPTGPIDFATHQFKGYSDQNLKIFIFDLKTGPTEGNFWTFDSGLEYAFAGSMLNAGIDFDQKKPYSEGFYQDDVLYFGYTQAETKPPTNTTKWTSGGVMRLFTLNSLYPDGNGDSSKAWKLSKVFDDTQPVTSSISKIQNYKTNEVWLFWGTGRYYYRIAEDIDDPGTRRRLYGIKEPCFSNLGVDFSCTDTLNPTSLGDATETSSSDSDGWYINLDMCTNRDGEIIDCADQNAAFKTERSITDPLATSIGVVFFTTTKPSANVCEFGGGSHLWAVNYKTGGAPSSSVLRGRTILQVSTGSIEDIDISERLVQKQDETGRGRRTEMIQGMPSGSLPGFQVPPPPTDKILHIRER